ncbi:MAG TPA: hypothetical protein VF997_14160 [Polyangia bacterium]
MLLADVVDERGGFEPAGVDGAAGGRMSSNRMLDLGRDDLRVETEPRARFVQRRISVAAVIEAMSLKDRRSFRMGECDSGELLVAHELR